MGILGPLRELCLHIGLPKTGTTFVQTVLYKNRDLLAEHGLGLGPYLDPQTGSHFPGFVRAVRDQGLEQVFAQIAARPEERILVSAEDICHLMRHPSPRGGGRLWAEDIRDAAEGLFDLRIIVFVRRQDFLRESSFFQAVRRHYSGSITDYHHIVGNYIYDHDARLRHLEEVFGRDALRLGIHQDGLKQDVLANFLNLLDLDIADRLDRDVGPQNTSMHRRKVLFLSQIPKSRERVAGLISRVVGRSSAIADDGGRYLLSPGQRSAMVQQYRDSNRTVAARYGITDPGPFVDLPDPEPDWFAPAPISRPEIAAVFRSAIATCWRDFSPVRAAKLSLEVAAVFASLPLRSARAGSRPLKTPTRTRDA